MPDGVDIPTLIRRAARQHAHLPAVHTYERTWTFSEIHERACRLANALQALGIRPDTPVATLRWNRPEHVEISLALLKIGAGMININPRLSSSEMAWQIENSESKVVLASAEFRDVLIEIRGDLESVRDVVIFGGDPGPFFSYEELLQQASPVEPDANGVSPRSLAYIRYSSGTTGTPKGVIHDQYTILAVTRNLLLDYVSDMHVGDVLLAMQGIYHGAGWFVLPCWIRGVPIVVLPDFSDAEAGLKAIKRFNVSLIKTVPTILRRLLDMPRLTSQFPSGRVRTIVYGGSPMPAAPLAKGIAEIGPIFVQLYGQAESPMTITVLRREEHTRDRLQAAGRPVTMAEVRVVDESGEDVPTGERGEVIVRGDHNMRGYWKQPPELVQRVVRDGWVYTGDIGVLDDAGFLYLVDRKSEMIVTGGLNVYPNEVEQVLYEHPNVVEAAVVGAPDESWGEIVVALLVTKTQGEAAERELLDFATARLPSFKRPRRILLVPSLPKNAAGKIMRRVAREPLWEGHSRRIS